VYPTTAPQIPANSNAEVTKAITDAWNDVDKTELKVMTLLKV